MTVTRESGVKELKTYKKLFIGGQWVDPASDGTIDIISPTTEEKVGSVPAVTPADVDAAVATARQAFDHGPWPKMSPSERAIILARVADEVESRLEQMKEVFTEEIGATKAVAEGYLSIALEAWRDAATLHERLPFEEDRSWGDGSGRLIREPIGVVGAVLPWTGPVTMSSLKMAPALAAGCTVVARPDPEGGIGPMLLAEAIEAAGMPPGVVSIITGDSVAGEHLVRHPGVDKVTFTGSTATGKRIMSICGERIARVTLELGGKSAAIIADDIPLDEFLTELAFAGIGYSGQVCAGLTRILVPRHREQEITNGLVSIFEAVKIGDPKAPETVLGPLVNERQRDRVEEYIRLGIEEGARLVTGGGRPEGLDRGWYVEPTLFAGVSNDMRIAQEEIFGPVICVIPFDSLDEAIELANDSAYGLSGAVFARDEELAFNVAREIRTGQIGINGWSVCVLEPFGGYKQSGLGREGGVEGLSAFLETKLIMRS